MSINVNSYQRRIHGKLVTVRGYDANRDAVYGIPGRGVVKVSHTENINRNAKFGIEATTGTYVQPHIMQGLGGLTAYLYTPGNERDLPTYKWRRSMIPKKGAYKIPKSESGNRPSNSKHNAKASDYDSVKL